MSEELKILREKLLERAEWWRAAQEDPHNINTAVYAALTETAQVVGAVIESEKNVTPIGVVGWKRPTLVECEDYAHKIGIGANEGEKFYNYYESNGWRVGRNPMKSWVSALANWKKGWEEKQQPKHVAVNPLKLQTVWELKQIVEAKEKMATTLRHQGAAEVSTGWIWSNEAARLRYVELKKEIKALNEQIARMG